MFSGPEFGYFWNGVYKNKFCDDGVCESNMENIDSDEWEDVDNKMIDYGFIFGGRISMIENIYIVPTYYMGLSALGKNMDFHNRSFQINISYALN